MPAQETIDRQKAALRRAMMRDEPLLLILDEPTASLDAYAEHAIFERYPRASERAGREVGAITVLFSHRFSFSTVRMADRVLVLEAGRVVRVGTHDELEREPGPLSGADRAPVTGVPVMARGVQC